MRWPRHLLALSTAAIATSLCLGVAPSGANSASPASANVAAVSDPGWIQLDPARDGIFGAGWPASVGVLVTADDPATAETPDVSVTLTSNAGGVFMGTLPGLAPGWLVTASYDGGIATHTVRDISITDADPATGIVHGTADPSSDLSVYVQGGAARVSTTADSSGNWVADLTGVSDIVPGSEVVADQNGPGNGSTVAFLIVPGLGFIQLDPSRDEIYGGAWLSGVDVLVTADDPATAEEPDVSVTLTSNAAGVFMGTLPGLAPGWVVTASYDGATTTHMVRDISITAADPATDTVRGTATPSTDLVVYGLNSPTRVSTTADSSGNWVADLSGAFDIQLESLVIAQQDATVTVFEAGTISIPPGVSLETPSEGNQTSGTAKAYWSEPLKVSMAARSGGTATAEITLDGGVKTAALVETSPGSGTYVGDFAALAPLHGTASISLTIHYPDGSDQQLVFTVYIDPSGVVRDTAGQPVVGATVTLYRSDDPGGPFTVVPDGSTIMGPGNRANPDLTRPGGLFGWDVSTGYYTVRAEKDGCTGPGGSGFAETGVMTIPPPVTDLVLVLSCQAAPSDLVALVRSMGLNRGLENDLTKKASEAAALLAKHRPPCKPLDAFVGRVLGELGNQKPKLTGVQAKSLLDAVYAIELGNGCRAAGSTVPAAEAAVVDLIGVIDGLQLSKGLANDLRGTASDAGVRIADGGRVCKPLDGLAGRVMGELGNQKSKLTGMQAKTLLDAVYAVELADGCRAAGSTVPAAEAAVVDLIGVIDGLRLSKGLANDLRETASSAGRQVATGAGRPCKTLDDLLRTARKSLRAGQLAAIATAVSSVQAKLGC